MILVTIGMQLPFDRLIMAMDALAPDLGEPVIAQIGASRFEPHHLEWHGTLEAGEFAKLAAAARLIVAHAGIGSILAALQLGKPIVVMPRRAQLGEHRNDHQLATARQLIDRPGLFVAMDAEELPARIAEGRAAGPITPCEGPGAAQLRQAVAGFIDSGELHLPGAP